MAKKETTEGLDINSLVAELNKELKINDVYVLDSNKVADIERLSSGSLTYDICTGGGYPKGRHTSLYGAESSGKTTNAIMALKQYQDSGDPRVALVLDAEFAFDKNYAKNLGVDLSRVIFRQPEEVTEAHDVLMYLLKKDAIGFFIVDSIAALQPRSVIENEADASNIGKHANAIGNMFKSANSYVGKQKVVGVWINQIRDKIGSFTGGVSEPAGHVPKFYSSIRIQVFRGAKIDNGDNTFTNKGKITVNKNKTAPPYQSGEYSMSHGLGIDVSEEVLDYGTKCNVLYKKGHSYYYDETFENDPEKNKDHVFLGKSKGDSKQFLDDNLELRKVLYDKILETYINK
jgi:recombination protein RecA